MPWTVNELRDLGGGYSSRRVARTPSWCGDLQVDASRGINVSAVLAMLEGAGIAIARPASTHRLIHRTFGGARRDDSTILGRSLCRRAA